MGISGREAARRLGVAPGTYQDWVTGTSRTTGKPIKISRLVALACAALAAGIEPPTQARRPPQCPEHSGHGIKTRAEEGATQSHNARCP